jgi:hypothetical protein
VRLLGAGIGAGGAELGALSWMVWIRVASALELRAPAFSISAASAFTRSTILLASSMTDDAVAGRVEHQR